MARNISLIGKLLLIPAIVLLARCSNPTPVRSVSTFQHAFATGAIVDHYDLVVQGGRVLDPESGLDYVRNVGIRDGRIEYISADTLKGERIVDATGLVVAPGCINKHPFSSTNGVVIFSCIMNMGLAHSIIFGFAMQ